MVLLDGLEKLINEHGSSVILKERISLANDKYSLLESANIQLEKKCQALTLDKQNQDRKIEDLEKNLAELQDRFDRLQKSNPDGYVCDHCGHPYLTRTGSRPDPTFGELGVKQKLFACDACGKISAFTPENPTGMI